MTTGTILDIVVILLLIPTIVYAVILNRKLAALRRSREELSKVVNSFNEATMRAEAGIPKLKKATTEANHTLKDRVEKAQTLRDDLAFMIERAEELAGRLEGAVRAARSEGVVAHAQPAASPYQAPPVAAPTTRAMAAGAAPPETAPSTRSFGAPGAVTPPSTLAAATLAQAAVGFEETAADLRNALGAARAEARVPGPMGATAAPGPLSRVARRSLSERVASERAPAPEPMNLDDERSEAERELLKALQSAR